MGLDKRGVSRGKCTECHDCEEYETNGSSILYEYCGHRPVQHEVISQISASETRIGSELEPPEKRPKPAERRNDDNEVIIVDNAEFQESAKTQGEDELVSDKDASLYGACM